MGNSDTFVINFYVSGHIMVLNCYCALKKSSMLETSIEAIYCLGVNVDTTPLAHTNNPIPNCN